ncbi:MAG: diguanylate cyclase [Campylobacterales bacterium]|nr:diguanylate cyclase [Campylobacterales bacterium]
MKIKTYRDTHDNIDYFKKVNDTYAHNNGDTVLKEVAEVLTNETREIDIVADGEGKNLLYYLLRPH